MENSLPEVWAEIKKKETPPPKPEPTPKPAAKPKAGNALEALSKSAKAEKKSEK
jgi:hypothetical protein